MSGIGSRQFEARRKERLEDERRQAAQALLNRHWIARTREPELYALIKDHYEALRDWFHDRTGWSLVMTRHFAKLEKVPAAPQAWMGIRSFQHPRDYAFFAYGLWYLEGKGEREQFLLSEMIEAIRDHLLTADYSADWTLYDHRLSMARALRKLRELGVMDAVEGDETDWAREGGERNVLYEASPLARYVLRRFPRELMAYETVEQLTEADGLGKRHRVLRRLIDEPVVYDWEWSEEDLHYVQTQRSWLIDQCGRMLHLEGRRFREALWFHWPDATGEPDLFPTAAGISDLVMLFAGELRRRIAQQSAAFEQDGNGVMRLTRAEFEAIVSLLKGEHGRNWGNRHRELTSGQLADELLAHLEEWKLGFRENDQIVRIYPALARWNGYYDWNTEAVEA